MSASEIDVLIDSLSANPDAGDEIVGTGGCRKLRWGIGARGKRGGARAITFYSGDRLPLFLITVFAKGERADLTQAERNALKVMTRTLVMEYARKLRR